MVRPPRSYRHYQAGVQVTAQQLFDKVAFHLLNQGKKCAADGNCLYRHEGLCCAAGCLLDDQHYELVIEGESMKACSKNSSIFQGIVGESNMELLEYLQDIHDERRPSEWREWLGILASQEGLSPLVFGECK